MRWTLKDIADAVGGTVYPKHAQDVTVEGVQFDSRQITPGQLFVPLVAERDGHTFIQDAIANGATASLWGQGELSTRPDCPIIQVSDTLSALQQFATSYLEQVNPQVVAITGSNGKTTTKDMTAAIASSVYRTHYTAGNFNNHIGVPLTILNMSMDTEVLILEMGMDHPGDLVTLSRLAPPDIAVITMIGEAHIASFGSREAIAQSKLDITTGFKPTSQLIYPGDEPLLKEACASVKGYCFGASPVNNLRAKEIVTTKYSTTFTLVDDAATCVTIPVPGKYNVNNALAALSVGIALGIPTKQSVEALAHFTLTKQRLEWLPGISGSYLLNDAYNASPSSMRAALEYFQSIDHPGRTILVLGDMRELGMMSKEAHESLGEVIDCNQVDYICLYGSEMQQLYKTLKKQLSSEKLYYQDQDVTALIDHLKAMIQPKDSILIKSSFGTGLRYVAEALNVLNDEH